MKLFELHKIIKEELKNSTDLIIPKIGDLYIGKGLTPRGKDLELKVDYIFSYKDTPVEDWDIQFKDIHGIVKNRNISWTWSIKEFNEDLKNGTFYKKLKKLKK